MAENLLTKTSILNCFTHQLATRNEKPADNLNWHHYCCFNVKTQKRTGLEE